MNKIDLHSRLIDSLSTGNLHGALSHMKEYHISHCYNPVRIPLYDSYLGTTRMAEVPCGSCYHCRETKQNEWVARSYYHLEDYKYCYFVTLTYRSFSQIIKNHPSGYVVDYLRDALWHYDNKNFNKTFSWNPCILVKSHYQNFLKRLRKQLPLGELTYILCGETGKKYGRPHFHFILFSKDTPITKQHIINAWSLKLALHYDGNRRYWTRARNDKESISYLLGRIQFDDLVNNGSITNQQIFCDGKYISAHKCFAYVCKYLRKDEFNKSRYRLAFDSLYSEFSTGHYVYSLDGNHRRLIINEKDFHLRQMYEKVNDFYTNNIKLFTNSYGSFIYYYPKDFGLFCSSARPFFECSRGTPIGSVYLSNHWQDISKGQRPASNLSSKNLLFPSYFTRKVEESRFPFRFCNSSKKSLPFVKGNIQAKLFEFDALIKDPGSHPTGVDYSKIEKSSFKSRHSFRDLTGNYYLLCHHYLSPEEFEYLVPVFRYSRQQREYVKIKEYSLESMYNIMYNDFFYSLPDHLHKLENAQKSQALFDEIPQLFDTFIDRFSLLPDYDYRDAVIAVRESVEQDVKHQQMISAINKTVSLE